MAENLYDSSELIELIKSGHQPEGYTTILNLIEFPKGVTLAKLKALYPMREDYDNALTWSAELLRLGTPVPALDLIISAVAVRLNLQLVTRDQHFKRIKSSVKELILRTES